MECKRFIICQVKSTDAHYGYELKHINIAALIQFGVSDNVSTDAVDITSSSVTWQWKESTAIDSHAVGYIGYHINYRPRGDLEWTLGSDIPYNLTEWQQGTVGQLQSNTYYEFDIQAYRINTDGEKLLARFSYIISGKLALLAKTDNGNAQTTSLLL